MTDLDEIGGLMDPATPANPAAKARKCRHPKPYRLPASASDPERCLACGHVFDPAVQRRNRNNRKRGNAHERRQIRDALGLQHLGPLNRERDGGDRLDPFVAQSKSYALSRFPNWMLRELDKLRSPGLMPTQTPILVVTRHGGSGTKLRAIVVVELDDWISLHGSAGVEDAQS